DALVETTRFLGIVQSTEGAADFEQELAVLHAVDHLDRLATRIARRPAPPTAGSEHAALRADIRAELEAVRDWLADPEGPEIAARCEALSRRLTERRRAERQENLRATAAGRMDPEDALADLEAM